MKEFPLDLLFADGTSSKVLEDGKKVVAIKVGEHNCIGLRNKSKSSLDRCERSCEREAQSDKDGVVTNPPSLQKAKEWFEKKKEINATVEMLKQSGIEADPLQEDILTSSRQGFNSYVFNMYTGQTKLVSSVSALAYFRPSISIDKTPPMPKARNYDWDWIKMQMAGVRSK